jgi:hypothetical protein
MNGIISEPCIKLRDVADHAMAEFGGLSAEQLNWKPDGKSWSVAQCFDHLVVTHSLYFPLFEKLAAGEVKATFWEKYSPLSGFFGRFLIKSLDPKNLKPMKTTAKAVPSSSEIGSNIMRRFYDHQLEIIDAIKRLPDSLDTKKTIITSPLASFVTYSLDDALTFVPMHCERHFNQAKRVAESEGFPK